MPPAKMVWFDACTSTFAGRSVHWPAGIRIRSFFPSPVADAHDGWDDGCGSGRKNYVYNIASYEVPLHQRNLQREPGASELAPPYYSKGLGWEPLE